MLAGVRQRQGAGLCGRLSPRRGPPAKPGKILFFSKGKKVINAKCRRRQNQPGDGDEPWVRRRGGPPSSSPGQLLGAAVPPRPLAPCCGGAAGTHVGTEQGAPAKVSHRTLPLPPLPLPHCHVPVKPCPAGCGGRRDAELSTTARWREEEGRSRQGERHRGCNAAGQSHGRALVPGKEESMDDGWQGEGTETTASGTTQTPQMAPPEALVPAELPWAPSRYGSPRH